MTQILKGVVATFLPVHSVHNLIYLTERILRILLYILYVNRSKTAMRKFVLLYRLSLT